MNLSGLISVLACALSVVATAAAAADGIPRFEPTECWFSKPFGKVECGYLIVPENRRKAGSNHIRVAVAIIRPVVGNRIPDPVVFVGGGPGYPIGLTEDGLKGWRTLISGSPALQQRDVILMERFR